MNPVISKEAFKAGAKAASEIFRSGKVNPASIASGAKQVMDKVALAAGTGAGVGATAGVAMSAGTAVGSGCFAGLAAIAGSTVATGALIGSGFGVALLGIGYGGHKLLEWVTR
ncbi:MAG TPA: hypothetical protein PKW95_23010 [bacterium]|nr:hypothetical protein [bacterium]